MKRSFVKFFVLYLGLLLTAPAAWAAESGGVTIDADGLFTESWFNPTTGDLSKDLQAAIGQGKTLAIFWEQPGCEYCQRMHEVNFKDEGTVKLIRDNFYVVMLNMRGDRLIKDFDGTEMTQADLSNAHRVTGTPVVEFRDQHAREVFRMPGYAENPLFIGVFDYVASRGYTEAPLAQWYKAKYLGKEASGG